MSLTNVLKNLINPIKFNDQVKLKDSSIFLLFNQILSIGMYIPKLR